MSYYSLNYIRKSFLKLNINYILGLELLLEVFEYLSDLIIFTLALLFNSFNCTLCALLKSFILFLYFLSKLKFKLNIHLTLQTLFLFSFYIHLTPN